MFGKRMVSCFQKFLWFCSMTNVNWEVFLSLYIRYVDEVEHLDHNKHINLAHLLMEMQISSWYIVSCQVPLGILRIPEYQFGGGVSSQNYTASFKYQDLDSLKKQKKIPKSLFSVRPKYSKSKAKRKPKAVGQK